MFFVPGKKFILLAFLCALCASARVNIGGLYMTCPGRTDLNQGVGYYNTDYWIKFWGSQHAFFINDIFLL